MLSPVTDRLLASYFDGTLTVGLMVTVGDGFDWHASTIGRPRGGGRSGGETRGNAYNRRRRKAWLLATFGDGETCPCFACGVLLDVRTLTVDRIVPGVRGGRYVRGNIRPACRACNCAGGAALTNQRATINQLQ
jgi:hypothetical protein